MTGDISLGAILIVISILTTAIAIGRKFGAFETTLNTLVVMFARHEQQDERQFSELRAMLDRRRNDREKDVA